MSVSECGSRRLDYITYLLVLLCELCKPRHKDCTRARRLFKHASRSSVEENGPLSQSLSASCPELERPTSFRGRGRQKDKHLACKHVSCSSIHSPTALWRRPFHFHGIEMHTGASRLKSWKSIVEADFLSPDTSTTGIICEGSCKANIFHSRTRACKRGVHERFYCSGL